MECAFTNMCHFHGASLVIFGWLGISWCWQQAMLKADFRWQALEARATAFESCFEQPSAAVESCADDCPSIAVVNINEELEAF
jgi:hypothetical protein